MLAQAGLTDADTVEWRAGPTPVAEVVGNSGYLSELPEVTTSLVGTDTGVESFVGVVSGEDGPWGVFPSVARVTGDDHVVAVSGITRPVGTVEGGTTAVGGPGWGPRPTASGSGDGGAASLLTRALEFTAESFVGLDTQ